MRNRKNMARDPFWLQARYPGVCCKCGESFKAGSHIFYYPNGRQTFYGACAEGAAADFNSAKADEGQWQDLYGYDPADRLQEWV